VIGRLTEAPWRPSRWRDSMPTISRPCWIPPASASAAAGTAPSSCTQPLHSRFTQEAFL